MLHSHICWRTEFFAGLYVSVHRSTIEKGQKEERKEKKDLSWVIRMEMGGGFGKQQTNIQDNNATLTV